MYMLLCVIFVCTALFLPFVLRFCLSVFVFWGFFSIVFNACYNLWISFLVSLLSSFFLSFFFLFLLLFNFFILITFKLN